MKRERGTPLRSAAKKTIVYYGRTKESCYSSTFIVDSFTTDTAPAKRGRHGINRNEKEKKTCRRSGKTCQEEKRTAPGPER